MLALTRALAPALVLDLTRTLPEPCPNPIPNPNPSPNPNPNPDPDQAGDQVGEGCAYLPHISRISPIYLPYISQAAIKAEKDARVLRNAQARGRYMGDIGEIYGRYIGY